MTVHRWAGWGQALVGAIATLLLLGGLPTARAAGGAPGPATPLRFGDQGPAVGVLQRDLLTLGYGQVGTADGGFGGDTWVGLVFFQRDHGLPPTGDADTTTWAALRDALAALPPGWTPVAVGAAGGQVRGVQSRLIGLGYAPGALDGVFGEQTRAALVRFQLGRALPPTGFLDPLTATVLGPLTVNAPTGGPLGTPTSGTAPVPAVLAYWATWGNDPAPMASLRAHGGALTWLSPYWFTLTGSGALRSRESDQAAVLEAAAAGHERVLALINDGSGVAALLSTAAGRQTAVQAIAHLVATRAGLSGVMVDFESLPAASGSDLTALVSAVRHALPAGDTVGVAVGPKVADQQPGEGLFQYGALGQVADLVQIMTYDMHDNSSGPGPIAATAWASRVATYAASVVPPSKVLLGVPAYGYDWTATGAATDVTVPQALALASRYGVTPLFDPASGEDHFHYTDGAGRTHTVWFESASGVAAKRALAVRLGLRGLAMWTIGGESPDFWPALLGG